MAKHFESVPREMNTLLATSNFFPQTYFYLTNVLDSRLIVPLNGHIRELLHTKKRKDDTYDHLKAVLGDATMSCDIEIVGPEITSCSQGPSFFSDAITEDMFNVEMLQEHRDDSIAFKCPSITMDNLLSPSHTLVQIVCQDHKGLLYDVMRTFKDHNIQVRDFVVLICVT